MNDYSNYTADELIILIKMKDNFIEILERINLELINKNKDLKTCIDGLTLKKIITLQ
jgi:hypothetical protein